ncbi:MAG: TIGR04552 family protein, partial [Bacteriovoracaceae bacterium]|nr:TIGR04552 family protein [Bacteriovoracaceae bacterium]
MERPSYLPKYMFDWDSIEVVVSGRSALDSKTFLGPMSSMEQVHQFLKGYGLDPADPVNKAELFGNFHEALQFIKRYFLLEGNPDGLDLKVPNSLYMITDIGQLFLMATTDKSEKREERLWAEAILKVMHTIVHTDKDLRSNYFKIVQTQIFDRFYRHIFRNQENALFLGTNAENAVALVDFETKSKKTRDSTIIKLLHKAENVAEELFDRVGVRFITHNRFETLQVVKYLIENNIVIPHNNKPSRAINTMIDMQKFKDAHQKLVKMAIRNNLSEERFLNAIEREIKDCGFESNLPSDKNKFTAKAYKSIQFTCRQLIEYKNPFLAEFNELRKVAKNFNPEENELARKVLSMDVSLVARDIRFFYPYEIQIVDQDAYKENTQGEASHLEYKKQQVVSAMYRIFKDMIEYKGLH